MDEGIQDLKQVLDNVRAFVSASEGLDFVRTPKNFKFVAAGVPVAVADRKSEPTVWEVTADGEKEIRERIGRTEFVFDAPALFSGRKPVKEDFLDWLKDFHVSLAEIRKKAKGKSIYVSLENGEIVLGDGKDESAGLLLVSKGKS